MATTINTDMIVLAREARGFNQQDLADKIRMSPTNLSKIERGEVGASEELVQAISEATGYPRQFFLQSGSIVPENLGYRKRQAVAQKLLTPINARANVIRNHVQFVTRALNIELPEVPVIAAQSAGQVAIKLRKRWDLPAGPIDNMIRVVENKGIVVASFSFGTPRADSRSIHTDDKFPVVCLNSELLGDRQRFSLAYELGQLVMHSFSNVSLDRDISHEANVFAAEFLMPAKDIKDDFKNGLSIPLLGEMKMKWKVSMISLLYRADDLGVITPNQKRYLIQQFNTLKIRRREPLELDVPIEHPKLLKRWIAQYRSKTKLSVPEIAAVLCLHTDEFLELYS
jgi:Zn-dependent peptidase ImmA (M78 family)/transcriptional regulator with XRE-family HTH domain